MEQSGAEMRSIARPYGTSRHAADRNRCVLVSTPRVSSVVVPVILSAVR
jgi:hypothetical protein